MDVVVRLPIMGLVLLLWAPGSVAHNYVGMTRFQDGGSNQCISVYTAILSLGNKY